ncbi:MAG TPA: hypothetical protein DCS93_27090 [Microscillaceae bacterium]|nr:hypothetical protein [Microscillaceae bacterium]
MNFKQFNKQIQKQFAKMCATEMLFRVDLSWDELWDTYLLSFEDEKVFRDPESSTHNCNSCKSFMRRYGNIVAVDSKGNLMSLFSDLGDVGEYSAPSIACDNLIRSAQISGVFFETYHMLDKKLNYESCKKSQKSFKLGIESNLKKYTQEEVDKFGVVNTKKIYEFNHFCVQLPKKYVDFSGNSKEQIEAVYRDKYAVFKRAMEEIPLDTLDLVIDLIKQGALLDGNTHLHAMQEIRKYKQAYEASPFNKDIFCWLTSYHIDERVAKFKNTLIGVFCTELAEGEELNKACLNWNKRVDPANYHKAKSPISQRQIEEAKKFIQENGLEEAFNRRLANIDDIKASEILHMSGGDGKIKEVSIFDNLKATSTRHKRSEFNKLNEVYIDQFMADVLPSCTSIEAYLDHRMEGNLVTLTTAVNADSKQITKWGNIAKNYSWTFNGNLAGKSMLKQAVKDAGGNVDGVLNFRLAWNDQNGLDGSDLDAWAEEPNRTKIGYSSGFRKDQNNKRTSFSGQLDVDNTNPKGKLAVENITWTKLEKMRDGVYRLWVNQYKARNSQGFKAEIEFNGEIYSYAYEQPVIGNVKVADVTLKNGVFSIKHHLPEKGQSKEVWGLETNNFYKVNLVCKSPNHWGDNEVGNLHYFFMLENCKASGKIRGFHNENLLPEILKHKKVMEVLGGTNMIEPTDKQLSGVGFNATVRDELIVKCSGNFKRMLKVKF